MNTSKRNLSTIKKPKTFKKVQNVCEIFNLLGSCTWLNLSTMEKNKPYVITGFNKHTTKFGKRVMLELDGINKLYLPERYNIFNKRQLLELGSQKYVFINRGPEGNSFKLEILQRPDIDMKHFSPASSLPPTATKVTQTETTNIAFQLATTINGYFGTEIKNKI